MGRKFIDIINGNDYVLNSPSDLSRILAVLPNGAPFWGGASLLMPGSRIPTGIDFYTHSWTFECWFRVSTGVMAVVAGVGVPNGWPNAAGRIWELIYDNGTGKLVFNQYTTVSGIYRSVTTAALTANTNICVHILCPVGATPEAYIANALSVTASAAPSGTPRPPDGSHKIAINGGSATTQGISCPAIYNKLLTAGERAANIAAMTAA